MYIVYVALCCVVLCYVLFIVLYRFVVLYVENEPEFENKVTNFVNFSFFSRLDGVGMFHYLMDVPSIRPFVHSSCL